MGLPWNYEGEESGVAAVYDEMRQAMHASIEGITWGRLERDSSVTYPCLTADDPGQPIVFTQQFPTPTGRLKLVPASVIPAAEKPDADYPLVLITGRQLEHWHTGSMTRRATVLDAIEPMATASMCGADLAEMGLTAGDVITVRSRRGEVAIHVRRDDGTPQGAVFMPFAYYEAAANLMTNAALDPLGKIPDGWKPLQSEGDQGALQAALTLAARRERPYTDVAVIMRCEHIDNRWQPWRWSLAEVVIHEPTFGTEPRPLIQGEREQRWLFPGFRVELFRDDAEGYHLNLTSPAPCWFVMWRRDEDTGTGEIPLARPVAV
eukprot:gene20355-40095_t